MSSNQAAMAYSRIRGMALVLTGAIFWGVSGTVAQYLFQQEKFSPEWLTVVRLLSSGLLLLAIAYRKEKERAWAVWKNKRDAFNLIIFSILGMLAVQYTYFAAIQYSNAATATVLQYLGPVLITLYVAVLMRRMPRPIEAAAVLLAVLGTFLLVTQGSIRQLSISGLALFWGLSSAVAMAFYTLYPHSLLTKWGSTIIVGWAMLIGGAGFSFVHPPWRFEGQWSIPAACAVVFIVIFGTLIAFYCYLESLKYLSAPETSILASVEPLSAAFTSVIWLNVSFGVPEWSGTLCIIATIALLSLGKSRN
ncbi:DMT family transporter [Siminovitchia fortis]|uniref:EamA family transporter n=1 Tax=Siminovitchia fortis TaxID=254758 RepID=A0A443IR87_9BACI|nr:EamA family transporter [Siminovitchia fortis]RWR09668.1 EamA family transporter [Siminovitchia fortis]WHY82290.1 EamA family transporter [Siminovitchia fortis]